MLIDTHCHLEMPKFDDDRSETVNRAIKSGVTRMITVGTNIPDDQKVISIAETYREVYCAVGIHPHDAEQARPENLEKLTIMARHPKVLAIGEIGLDFFKNYSPRDAQEGAFFMQLGLAQYLDLPVIIHDRDAHKRVLEMLADFGGAPYKGVFHCFAGDVQMAEKVLDLGFHVSFTGTITFNKKMESHDVIRMVPKDRLMVETDCPFLTPAPHRGHRNEPAYTAFVAKKVAELWEISEEEVAQITTDNAYRLFGFEAAEKPHQIAYTYKDSLYIAVTNRCSNRCSFCAKWPDYALGPHNLRLPKEPTVDEILEAAQDVEEYPEVVFCGFGEPTERLDVILEAANGLRGKGAKRLRLNTNGQGDLINEKPIAQLLKGVFGSVSISLNAQDAQTYQRICRSRFGENAYDAVKSFIVEAKKYVPSVTATIVRGQGVDEEACRRIAEEELGVAFRVRG